jgi:hypothetical protein
VDFPAQRKEVAARTPYGNRVNVGSVHFKSGNQRCQRGAYCPGAAAQVNNNRRPGRRRARGHGPETRNSLADEQFRPAPWHKNTWLHPDAQAAKFCPAENVFERKPVYPPLYGVSQIVRAKA